MNVISLATPHDSFCSSRSCMLHDLQRWLALKPDLADVREEVEGTVNALRSLVAIRDLTDG